MSVFLLPLAVGWPEMVQCRPEVPELVQTSAVLGVASFALLTVFYLAVSRWHRRSVRPRRPPPTPAQRSAPRS